VRCARVTMMPGTVSVLVLLQAQCSHGQHVSKSTKEL
jgi:hypothetical protein